MLWFKNKNKKIKCSKYSFKASDFEITVLVNFIVDTVNELKQAISEEEDNVLLADFIYKKYALMSLTSKLGFSPFNEELENRKSIDREIKIEMDRRKKMLNPTPNIETSKEVINDITKDNDADESGGKSTW